MVKVKDPTCSQWSHLNIDRCSFWANDNVHQKTIPYNYSEHYLHRYNHDNFVCWVDTAQTSFRRFSLDLWLLPNVYFESVHRILSECAQQRRRLL
ncbi:unnamed protein product [Schistosoma rodhaini]|nr:unnamed protein product [Schistosoma rodhaini]